MLPNLAFDFCERLFASGFSCSFLLEMWALNACIWVILKYTGKAQGMRKLRYCLRITFTLWVLLPPYDTYRYFCHPVFFFFFCCGTGFLVVGLVGFFICFVLNFCAIIIYNIWRVKKTLLPDGSKMSGTCNEILFINFHRKLS